MKRRLYLPLDVRFFQDPKICSVSDMAQLLYLRICCHAKDHETDGVISVATIRSWGWHPRGIKGWLLELTSRGLLADFEETSPRLRGDFEETSPRHLLVVPAFLQHNLSRQELDNQRNRDAIRKRRARCPAGQVGDVRQMSCTEAEAEAEAEGQAGDQKRRKSLSETFSCRAEPDVGGSEEAEKPKSPRDERRAAEIREVWECWLSEHVEPARRPLAKLNAKRRGKIVARLQEGYTAKRLCEAIRGAKNSPYHMGANDSGKRYTELVTLLRDGSQVERFEAEAPAAARAPARTKAEREAEEFREASERRRMQDFEREEEWEERQRIGSRDGNVITGIFDQVRRGGS